MAERRSGPQLPTFQRMRIHQELAEFTSSRESALTVGVFDGVHRGHRHLLNRVKQEGASRGLLAGVVTFRNHPASILCPDFEPRYLTSFDERLSLMDEQGMDFVVPATFDQNLSNLETRSFVSLLQHYLRMRGMVIGPDFAMGHDREGNIEALSALGEEMGFWVRVVDVLVDGGRAIRSTSIRDAIGRGDVALAAEMLGRNFALEGPVVGGAGRGKELGFPTANLQVAAGLAMPRDGIYATWAHLGGQRYMAATSVGRRPTFEDDGERTIEAFILDFDHDVYDKHLRLGFVERLRDEIKYAEVEELQRQVGKDVAQTRAILRASPSNDG